MGEAVSINGRFKDEKGRYEEIKSVLIEGLSQHLRPNYYPVNWEDYFDIEDEYMELSFDTFGNLGFALEYIENDFISQYNDVKCEFFYLDLNSDNAHGDKVAFDGEKIIHGFNSIFKPSFEKPYISEDGIKMYFSVDGGVGVMVDIECPECGSPMFIESSELYCSECGEEIEEIEEIYIEDLYYEFLANDCSMYKFEIIVPTSKKR